MIVDGAIVKRETLKSYRREVKWHYLSQISYVPYKFILYDSYNKLYTFQIISPSNWSPVRFIESKYDW